jgi:acetyl-CoA C-acetyltransferase
MTDVLVLSAKRTPIGKFLGALKNRTAPDLGHAAARAALEAAGVLPAAIDLAVMGCARQAGSGPNPARQAAWRAGIRAPAFTVNMACASGMQALALAAQAIRAGEADLALAGGMESMSRVPHFLPRAREGYRLGHVEVQDGMYRDGFLCPLCDLVMGEAVDRHAEREGVSRQEADEYALESQRRCEAARKEGRFDAEIAPLFELAKDEHPRDGVTLASLGKLPPAFSRGIVTAGNASGITDGAAALVLASEAGARRLGARPIGRLGRAALAAIEPADFGIGPVPAIERLLRANGRTLADYDLVELNEAFAAQVLLCQRRLAVPEERLNPNGGAIAIGHPIGASGARIVVTLFHELARRGARRGLAALCVSGGMGMAIEVESALPG